MPFEWLHSRLVKPFVDGRQRPRRGVRSRAIAMEILEERTLLFAASVTWNPSYSQSYEGLRGIRVGWYPLEEGEALSVGDATQYTIDYGDGYSDSSEDIYGDEKHVPTFYHAFDQGTYLITVTASNRLGSASDTTTLEIPNNVAPGVQLRIDGDPDAGKFLPLGHYAPSASLSGYGTIKDPGPDAPWTGTIDFGDGTGAETLVVTPLDRAIHYRREGLQFENPGIGTVGNAAYFNFSHTYEKAGTYTWTVNVTDKDGATSPINFIAHVPEQDIQFAYAYWDSYGAPVAGEEDDGIVEEELFGEGVTDARDPGTLSILYGVTNPTWIVEPIEVQLYWSNAEGTLTPATANLLEADPRKPELRVPPDVLLPPSSDTTSLVIEFDPNDKIEEVDDSNNRGEVALLPEIELLDEPDFAWVAVKVGEASSAPFGGLDIPYRITSIHLIDQPIEVQPYWSNDAGELTPATDEVLIVDPSETKLHIDAEAFKAPNADTTSVVVSLDPNDKISERNETNNQGQANLVLDVGALRLEGNFDRDDATGRWDANGLVVIGLKPHSNEPMRRLVTVDGSLWYDGNVIHVEGTVSAALGQLNAPLFQGTFEIDAGDAVTRFVQESVSGLAGDYTLAGAELSIDTIEFVNPGGGSVSDGRIELQGSLTLPTPGGPLVLEVEGANRIVVSGSGVSLRGEITVTNPIAAFKIAELDVLNQSLRLGYLPTMSGQPARLYLTGNVTLPNLSTSDIFKFGGVKAALDGTVYLWVENGRLQTEYNGTLTVSDVLTIPGVNWELEQIKLTVRTEDDFVQGFASVGIPFSGIKKYLPLAHLRIQGLLQFVDGKLNAIALQGDHIDLPIPLTGGLGRFQRLSGGVINLALDSLKDIEDVLFVGGVGATFLPEFEVTVPPVLGDLNFITSLLRIDLDVGANPAQLFHLQTKFPRLPGENLQIGGTVEASVLGGLPAPFAQGLLTLSGTGTYIQNGATIVHDLRGTFTSLSGVVTGKGHLHMGQAIELLDMNQSSFLIDQFATVHIDLPKFRNLVDNHGLGGDFSTRLLLSLILKGLGDTTAEGTLRTKLYGNLRQTAGFSEGQFYADPGKLGISDFFDKRLYFGYHFDFTRQNFDLTLSMRPLPPAVTLTSTSVAAEGEVALLEQPFVVTADMDELLIAASWEHEVEVIDFRLRRPDGTLLSRSDLDGLANLTVLDGLSGPTYLAIGLKDMEPGTWSLVLPDASQLGATQIQAYRDTATPEISITGLSKSGTVTTIAYEAYDPDSVAQVGFYYDTDNTGFDGRPIDQAIVEVDAAGELTWDTWQLPPGEYYIYAVADDGEHASVRTYFDQPLVIEDKFAPMIVDNISVNREADSPYYVKSVSVSLSGEANVRSIVESGRIANEVQLKQLDGTVTQIELEPSRFSWDHVGSILHIELTTDGIGGTDEPLLQDGTYRLQFSDEFFQAVDGSTNSPIEKFFNTAVHSSAPPTIAEQTFTVQENSPNGTFVGTVVAGDPDVGDDLKFTISVSSGSGAFAIDAASGQITVADSSQLNAESTSRLLLDVRVTDSHDLSASATITIMLTEQFSWTNSHQPLDVNADGVISPLDALVIINYINERGSVQLTTPIVPVLIFYDANGDGFVSPLDVLTIVNWLNAPLTHGEDALVKLSGAQSPVSLLQYQRVETPITPIEDIRAVSTTLTPVPSEARGSARPVTTRSERRTSAQSTKTETDEIFGRDLWFDAEIDDTIASLLVQP